VNPRHERDFKTLVETVKNDYTQLQPHRQKRKELIDTFVGSDYRGDEQAKAVYLNLIALAVSIYVRQLAVRAPTARVLSPFRELRPLAKDLSLACVDAAKDCNFGQILRMAVTESLLSPMATVKKGLRWVKEEGGIDQTEPTLRLVSFDDYVRDMSARSAYDPEYEGDRYPMGLEELYETYPHARKLELSDGDIGTEDEDGGERAESRSHRPFTGDEALTKKVMLQDVYLRREKLLVTWCVQKPAFALDVVEYVDGIDDGPYDHLFYNVVPDNAMPLAPLGVARNLHNLANSLFRRMAQQARDQKEVVGFSGEETAILFKKAMNGEGIVIPAGSEPKNIIIGGIDPKVMALFLQVKDIFSWSAGNLDSLGGLSAMADTARQEDLLSKSSGAQLADMQDAAVEFAQKIFRTLAWFEWTDPIRKRKLKKRIPGTDIHLSVPWTPETRQGDFLDFNFTIIPSSMRDDSPAAKIAKLNSIMAETILPMLPVFQQQGLTLDARGWVALIADYANVPELERLIVAVDQPPEQPHGDPNPAVTEAPTTRRYERISRSAGPSRNGKDANLAMMLMGGSGDKSGADMMTGGK